MEMTSVRANNRKRLFEITASRRVSAFPYSRCEPPPTSSDPVQDLSVDPELGREGLTYVLRSGSDGVMLMDAVLRAHRGERGGCPRARPARRVPADRISEVRAVIDPTTAEGRALRP